MLVKDEVCESCGRHKGERHKSTESRPDIEELMVMESDGYCEATDGCTVEPDGYCPHGHQSWLLNLHLI